MPRIKGVPLRRNVGQQELNKPDEVHHGHTPLLGRLSETLEEVEVKQDHATRPVKRRRKALPVQAFIITTNVELMESWDILGFLELYVICSAIDNGVEVAAACVRVDVKSTIAGEPLLVSLVFQDAAGRVFKAALNAPSVATAKNFVRLLEDGVLGLAVSNAWSPNASIVSPQPVLYAWEPQSLPSDFSSHFMRPLCAIRASELPRPKGQQNATTTYSREDWSAAVIVSHTGPNGDDMFSTDASPPRCLGLRLGVTSSALQQLKTGDPEDVHQRVWQGQLLDILRWLLPHVRSDSSVSTQQLPTASPPSPRKLQSPAGGVPRTPAPVSEEVSPSDLSHVSQRCEGSGGTTAAAATQGFDPEWLYDFVKPSGEEPHWMGDPVELRPRLRPYQRRAVAWLLQREQANADANSAGPTQAHGQQSDDSSTMLHPLWRRLHTLPGSATSVLYVNPYTGALSSEPFPAPGPVRGGILADEMGLGKTVELLALITANRFFDASHHHHQQPPAPMLAACTSVSRAPERVHCSCGVQADDPNDPQVMEYTRQWILCDSCNAWMHSACVGVKRAPRTAWVCTRCLRARAMSTVSEPCGTTLIVVPSAILQQWYDEIRRHVHPGALRVIVYGGQTQAGVCGAGLIVDTYSGGDASRDGSAGQAPRDSGDGNVDVVESLVVSAAQLAAADVVLTTYDVLKRDVARQPELQTQERSLRYGKRYEVVPTPLTRLRWWRVVLDEAQMVESSTAKAAEMAMKLDAVHRWCVTGTPISRGLEDMYGLFAFLGARPWSERRWWNRCVQRPAEAGEAAGRLLLLHLLCSRGISGDNGLGNGGGLMWRSVKRDVEMELGLPPQHTHVSRLRLNAVELHFYNQQHQDCATKVRAVLPLRMVVAMESGQALGDAVEVEQQQHPDMEAPRLEVGRGQQAGSDAQQAAAAAAASLSTELGCGDAMLEGLHLPDLERLHKRQQQQADALRELQDIHRRRWELSRHGGPAGGAAASPPAACLASKSSPGVEDPMFLDVGNLDGVGMRCEDESGRETEERRRGADSDAQPVGDVAAPSSGPCHVGPSSPRVDGPRKTPATLAASVDRPLKPHEARKLLGPLLKLRQACCHPQVGSGGIRALAATGQPLHHHGSGLGGLHHHVPMTMQEILAVLVIRAKLDAEEAQRQLIASLNGLAALMIIQEDRAEAIATYRKALRVMEDNKPDIGTDPLQRLHTLYNLSEILAAAGANDASMVLASIPRTLRDHTLAEDAAAIRSRYLEQRRQQLAAKEAEYSELAPAASPFHGATGWYIAAIDLLVMEGHGQAATDYIKEKLLEGDTYRQKMEMNASSMALRFHTLHGMKVLLSESLDAIEEHRSEAIRVLEDLGHRTRQVMPAPSFVEQAGLCWRCRSSPMRTLVCAHCRLDECFIQWEVRLFALYSRALTAGATVTAEEAARRAQMARVRFTGRGGLHEEQGAEDSLEEGGDDELGSRRGANVAGANTSWRQSEVEMVLRLLVTLVRQHMKHRTDEHVSNILREGKAHVDRLKVQRRLLVAARSVSLAQRTLLYAHDELAMATMRMRLAREGEHIAAHEGNLKLYLEAVPVKSVELTNERILAEGDLQKRLGTLRYLHKLQTIQRQQQELQHKRHDSQVVAPALRPGDASTTEHSTPSGITGDATATATAGGPSISTAKVLAEIPQAQPISIVAALGAGLDAPARRGSYGVEPGEVVEPGETELDLCPICHDPLECISDCVMLPCGHQMHPVCSEALVGKMVAPSTPYHQKRINCPTCRIRVHIADIAYINADLTRGSDGMSGADNSVGDGPWAGEAAVTVRGSFGTKIEAVVRRIKFLLGQDAAAKALVFSQWADLLELVAAALLANAVPHVVARGRAGMAAALAAFKDQPGEMLMEALEDDDQEPEEEPYMTPAPSGRDGELGAHFASGSGTKERSDCCDRGASSLSAVGKVEEVEVDGRWATPQPQSVEVQGAAVCPGLPPAASSKQPQSPTSRSIRALLSSPGKPECAKPRVLLLQLKQGGAGLNLTEAQHVVLVEPQLDPAAEAQAVGRVHRIGQCHPTHVHRFVVADTVEEQVYKLSMARAHSMDLSVPRSRNHSRGVGVGGDGCEHLTLRDVALLLDSRCGSAPTFAPMSAKPAAAAGFAAAAPLATDTTAEL